MTALRTICMVIGAWFLAAVLIFSLLIWARAIVVLVRTHRCALCRVRCETLVHCRFGEVCVKCQDAVFRLYHYRKPRLTNEQVERIMRNLRREELRDQGYKFDGDGWKNG